MYMYTTIKVHKFYDIDPNDIGIIIDVSNKK